MAIIAFLSWYQQKQIMGRNADAEVNPQQQMMMRIGPLLYVFFAFVSPAAIGIYFLVSTLWRVGQQAFITRSLYRGEDSVGRQAQKAMAGGPGRQEERQRGQGSRRRSAPAEASLRPRTTVHAAATGQPRRRKAPPPTRQTAGSGASSAAKPHPRSRKKKKRK